jgi:ABC-type nitrate/sulfonate/bicarbonate transport system substrate-binding protein
MPIFNKPDRLHEVVYARAPFPTPLAVAVQLGWIQDAMRHLAGVDVRSLHETTDPADLPHHFEIDHLNAFRQGGSIPVIWARANRQDTRVIGLTWTDEYQALVALPQSGVHRVKDLRGRRIGLPKHDIAIDHARAAALRGFRVLLESEGMSLADVQIVDLEDHEIPSMVLDGQVISMGTGRRGRHSYGSEVHAIKNGLVDAVYVKDVRGAQAALLMGAQVIADINGHPDPYIRINNGTPRPLTVNAWMLEHYPHLVDCLVEQVCSAGEWARSRPEQTLTVLSKEMGWSPHWINYTYGDQVHRNLGLDLSRTNVERFASMKSFLLEQGFIPHDFDLDAWIDPAPLERFHNRRKGRRIGASAAAGAGNWSLPSLPTRSFH